MVKTPLEFISLSETMKLPVLLGGTRIRLPFLVTWSFLVSASIMAAVVLFGVVYLQFSLSYQSVNS